MAPRVLAEELRTVSAKAETEASRLVGTYLSPDSELAEAIRYVLPDVGLRVRPYLLGLACELGGAAPEHFEGVAGAIELMQVSTLVTDDFLDNADLRNRRPSLPCRAGAGKAVLVAEVLKSLASSSLSQACLRHATPVVALECVRVFEDAYCRVCVGQYRDLEFETRCAVTEAEYLQMITDTTAAFIRAPLMIGALLTGLSEETREALSHYGLCLGVAYQIRDDVIDLIGDPELTGKPFAGDIKQQKRRLPLIHALEHTSPELRGELLSLLRRARDTSDAGALERIVAIILEAGSVEYAMSKTRGFCQDAKEALSALPAGRPTQRLAELADLVSCFET